MKMRVAEYNVNPTPGLRVAHMDFYISQNGEYICVPFTKGELAFANELVFAISSGRSAMILQKGLQDNVNDLERRLINLTDAIDDFLNDARERPAVDKIERAMNDYGMRE